jgi:hypothetical protein
MIQSVFISFREGPMTSFYEHSSDF